MLRRVFGSRLQRRLGLDRCTTRLLAGDADRTVERELAAVGVHVQRAWSHGAAGGLVTASRRPAAESSSVGPPAPGVSVRITDTDIEVRPPWGTSWIPTGVQGRLDASGELHLTS